WSWVANSLPSSLALIGALPFWESLRGRSSSQAPLLGINCAVVGLLLAAFFDPVWTSAITSRADFGLALVAFGMLVFWRVPPWLVVLIAAIRGGLIAKVVLSLQGVDAVSGTGKTKRPRGVEPVSAVIVRPPPSAL